jgi:hypothetical protein
MAVQRLGRDTTSVDGLSWDGRSLGDATADSLWGRLPHSLKQIARAEFRAGNSPVHILFNETRQIVLLSFAMPPMTARPPAEVAKIHTSFTDGNYCYDGTLCTYEDIRMGFFLAFDDPECMDAL